MAVENKKLIEVLASVGNQVAISEQGDNLLEHVLRTAQSLFGYDNAIIRLISDDGTYLENAVAYGYDDAVLNDIPMGSGVMGQVALSAEPILVKDVTKFPGYIHGIAGAKSELAVPLIVQSGVIGVLSVESRELAFFSAEDIEPLTLVASQAAMVVNNDRLYRQLNSISAQYFQLNQINNRIVRNADIGIYTLDMHKRISSWNPKIAELSGVLESEASGRRVEELFPYLTTEGVIDGIDRVLTTGETESFELSHRDRYGSVRYQRRDLSPMREAGSIVGCVVLVQDITENRRLSEQVLRSEKLAEVGRMSAGVAHEINNPLSVIGYAAKLLADREGLPDFEIELIDRIISETERLTALTGGLLSFSRSTDEELTLLDLNDLIADTMKFIAYEIDSSPLEVDINYQSLPLVKADQNRIKQVLLNLLKNAMHALDGSGTISIRTRTESEQVIAEISDTGPGINESIRARIFEPFFSTKKEGEGTGLGLYLCRKIVKEHGGDIDCRSTVGEGTTFELRFPAYLLSNEGNS